MSTSNTQHNKQSIDGRSTYRTILLAPILIGLFFLAGHLWDTYASSTTVVSETVPGVEKAPSGVKFAKIQDIQVGKRAIGKNPEISDEHRQFFFPDPDPATWRKLTLEMTKSDGKRLDITLLRPLSWIEESGATPGATIHLDLEELGAHGDAKVVTIDLCPPIKPGKGNVITGTFHHEAANTIDLHVDGLEKPIGTTDNHPFWSVTRQEFVDAGKLLLGEELQLHNGQTAKIVQALPRPGPESVHNIEVMNEHVYRVAHEGVLVHNSYGSSGQLSGALFGVKSHLAGDYKVVGSKVEVKIDMINTLAGANTDFVRVVAGLKGIAKENNVKTVEVKASFANPEFFQRIKELDGKGGISVIENINNSGIDIVTIQLK